MIMSKLIDYSKFDHIGSESEDEEDAGHGGGGRWSEGRPTESRRHGNGKSKRGIRDRMPLGVEGFGRAYWMAAPSDLAINSSHLAFMVARMALSFSCCSGARVLMVSEDLAYSSSHLALRAVAYLIDK